MKTGTWLLLCVLLCAPMVRAEVPALVAYQGYLSDASGNPVPDGSYSLTFRLYTTSTGGSPVWTETHPNVAVSGGVFSTTLGHNSPLNLTFDQPYWLGIQHGSDPELVPRIQLTSVPYARNAAMVGGSSQVVRSVAGVSGEVNLAAGPNVTIQVTADTIRISASGGGLSLPYQGSCSLAQGVAFGVEVTGGSSNRVVEGIRAHHSGGVTGTLAVYSSGGGSFGPVARGVQGINETTVGSGVYGVSTATSGTTYGVYGSASSTTGIGVYGDAGASRGPAYGVFGESESSQGAGVFGRSNAYGGEVEGVYGEAQSTAGIGVHGYALATVGTTCGVRGRSASSAGVGVYGIATATVGSTFGVRGRSSSTGGTGVFGESFSPTGATYGVRGRVFSASGFGVYGESTNGIAVYAAGNFAASGTKSCAVRSSSGPRLMYCQESPECWFEDFGSGHLVEGRAHVELDPLFLETVTIDEANPMKVFVELGGDCRGVYVLKGRTGFDVIELGGGTSSVPFDFRVVAKRRGYEGKRLDMCEAARNDPFLYPEEASRLVGADRADDEAARGEGAEPRAAPPAERPEDWRR